MKIQILLIFGLIMSNGWAQIPEVPVEMINQSKMEIPSVWNSVQPETYLFYADTRMPKWVSSVGGSEVNCGGLDLTEVYRAAKADPRHSIQIGRDSSHLFGTPRFRLRIGDRFYLNFRSAANREDYMRLSREGNAIPAYACWCAYGLGHPAHPHLAASNEATITLVEQGQHSLLYFNLRQRGPSWQDNPTACIRKSAAVIAKIPVDYSIEIKRASDHILMPAAGVPETLPVQRCQ